MEETTNHEANLMQPVRTVDDLQALMTAALARMYGQRDQQQRAREFLWLSKSWNAAPDDATKAKFAEKLRKWARSNPMYASAARALHNRSIHEGRFQGDALRAASDLVALLEEVRSEPKPGTKPGR